MFEKLVAIEPINLLPAAKERLHAYAKEVVLCADMPQDDAEIIRRVGNADAILVSYTTLVNRAVLESCPKLRYVGMCCSLYSEKSANVDIACARELGITVTGIRDYGDEGVVEYVVSELVRVMQGLGERRWDDVPRELTGLTVGIVGLGTSGGMIARGLQYFGAQVRYFSRTRKPDAEATGIEYLPLDELLAASEVVCTCLNKNTVLLHEAEFAALGNRKILFNTGLSPAGDAEPFRRWLEGDNLFFCDTVGALGDTSLLSHKNVVCTRQSAGMTKQAHVRLSEKVLAHIDAFVSAQA